ncbi:MAG: hypothetical protein QXP22_02215 [Candidatus Anstonellales archaeon]
MSQQKQNTEEQTRPKKVRVWQRLIKATKEIKERLRLRRAEIIIKQNKDKIPREIQAKLIGTQNEEEKNTLKIIVANILTKINNDYTREEAFEALNSILQNPNFKSEWLTAELGEKISSIANTIIKNTPEQSTRWAFKALNSLLQNPNFTPKFIPLIEIMIKGKKGPEIQKTLEKFNEIIKEEKSIVLLQDLANKDEKIINEAVAIMLNPVFFNNLPDKEELIEIIKAIKKCDAKYIEEIFSSL